MRFAQGSLRRIPSRPSFRHRQEESVGLRRSRAWMPLLLLFRCLDACDFGCMELRGSLDASAGVFLPDDGLSGDGDESALADVAAADLLAQGISSGVKDAALVPGGSSFVLVDSQREAADGMLAIAKPRAPAKPTLEGG